MSRPEQDPCASPNGDGDAFLMAMSPVHSGLTHPEGIRMNRSSLPKAALPMAAILAVVAALIIVVGGVLGRGAAPSPAPSDSPVAAPTVQPASPTPVATPEPSDDPSDGPLTVDLKNLTDHDVSVVIDDQTGTLAGAASGQPGDGMSVRWHDVKVENVDADTIRIVWVGLPRDEQLSLSITGKAGAYDLRFVQAGPPAYSDAVGFDRILNLDFAAPVSAPDVKVTIEDAPANG
jgi:hypothetical protein